MSQRLRLSVLDQTPVPRGHEAGAALRETIELAKACESLGFHRYWLAEHHNTFSFAGSAPEILAARVAAETRAIRVGSGGVMLNHYAPLKVAEQFRMLESLSPGRIDLGLGRAPGSDQRTAQALIAGREGWGIDAFPAQVHLLQQYLEQASGGAALPDNHPYRGIHAMPEGPTRPEMWLLGSGIHSAIYAGELGLAFSHAHFINAETSEMACATYRDHFKPGLWCEAPRVSLGVSVLAAPSAEEAKLLAASRNLWVVRLLTNRPITFPPPEEAVAYPYSEQERAILEMVESRSLTGTPADLRDRLHSLAEAHGAEELVIVTITHDFAARRRSYALLAEVFGLGR